MADNPYTLIFEQEPNQIIARTEEFAKVNIRQNCFIIPQNTCF